MTIFDRSVFLLAKASGLIIKRLGRGGGSAFPGLLAERIDRRLLTVLSQQLSGVIVVCGTNGKTTTARFISSLLEKPGQTVVHNRSGSNLTRGILSTLIQHASWTMHVPRVWGVFEVDEAVVAKILPLIKPTIVVATNLFRDQLDRYGEVDTIAQKWRQAFATLPPETVLVLNADDSLIASLAGDRPAKTFGINGEAPGLVPSYADSRRCPLCHQPLTFQSVTYSHLGNYTCPNGDFARPKPTLWAEQVTLLGMSGSIFQLHGKDLQQEVRVGLAGLYNIYNVLAAILTAQQAGVDMTAILRKVPVFESVFGRLEQVRLGEVVLTLILVKNPTGFNQVIQTLKTEDRAESFWFILNDRLADGRDISWIWDVEFEQLVPQVRQALVGGSRALDLAVRLKYAFLPEQSLRIQPALAQGLRTISSMKQGHVYCLCTYTAMLELRQLLAKQRKVQPFYKD